MAAQQQKASQQARKERPDGAMKEEKHNEIRQLAYANSYIYYYIIII